MSIVTVTQTVSIEGPQSTVTNSLSNDTIVFSLIAICAALLMGLITTIVALIIIVAVFRRKIKELQRSQTEGNNSINIQVLFCRRKLLYGIHTVIMTTRLNTI